MSFATIISLLISVTPWCVCAYASLQCNTPACIYTSHSLCVGRRTMTTTDGGCGKRQKRHSAFCEKSSASFEDFQRNAIAYSLDAIVDIRRRRLRRHGMSFRLNAEWRLCIRPMSWHPSAFIVRRPSQSERLVYLKNGLTWITKCSTNIYADLFQVKSDITSLATSSRKILLK